MKNFETLPLYDKLMSKVYAYYQTIWFEKWRDGIEHDWLNNFTDLNEDKLEKEKANMLYLLSKFMYFGNVEIRQLLLSLFRDLFKYPIVAEIRRRNNHTLDLNLINTEFYRELANTRFLGVGNPSESGTHLLLFLRQVAGISKDSFIDSKDIFSVEKIIEKLPNKTSREVRNIRINNAAIKRYIFVDDFCGSGTQAKQYLSKVNRIKKINPDCCVNYFMLFSTTKGLQAVRGLNVFDNVEAVFILDETFKTFSDESRYFKLLKVENSVDDDEDILGKEFSKETALKYGSKLLPAHPIGYKDCQLLIGFSHNTPDNTLPIFWSENNNWSPIFKRYNKF